MAQHLASILDNVPVPTPAAVSVNIRQVRLTAWEMGPRRARERVFPKAYRDILAAAWYARKDWLRPVSCEEAWGQP